MISHNYSKPSAQLLEPLPIHREISIADDLDALRQAGTAVHPEHHTAQDAILGIADVIHLTKSKRFLDEAMPAAVVVEISYISISYYKYHMHNYRYFNKWANIIQVCCRATPPCSALRFAPGGGEAREVLRFALRSTRTQQTTLKLAKLC